MTIAEVCDHFVQRELTKDNSWRSYSTKKAYKAYLTRWVIPHWGSVRLSEVRTTEVELWLRSLPLAKSSCAKIRGILSVLFNHACRHELFDSNPIRLVRQSAKRRTTPSVLTPAEIKALIHGLGLRERTLVLLAASTGLRQSELFGLKWGDNNFAQGTMNVTRSIVYGVVGPSKTESSQKPVPVHPTVLEALSEWRGVCLYNKLGDWVFAGRRHRGRKPISDMGPGDLTQVHSSRCAARRDSETVWMAYVPAHILDSAAKRRYRVQGDAGTVAPFLVTIHVRCLHASGLARKTCGSGGSARPGIRF
jgi:integrase